MNNNNNNSNNSNNNNDSNNDTLSPSAALNLSIDTDITYEKTPLSSKNNGSASNNHIELVDIVSKLSPEQKDFLLVRIKSDDKLFRDQEKTYRKKQLKKKKRGCVATIVDVEEVENKKKHFFPCRLHEIYTIIKRHGRIYNIKLQFRLNILQRIFLVLNEPTSSTLASLYSTCILVFTLLSVVVFVVSTDRSYLAAPSTCDTPVCANDPNICPNTIICEPQPINSLRDIEYACLIAFVIDYFMRLAFVPIIHPRLCGVIEDNTDIIDDLEEDQIHREQYVMLETGTHIDMEYKNVNWLKKFVIFIIKPMNLIDFVAIIPWFLSFTAISSTSVTIVRVLRLGRILRILRVGKDSEWLIIMVLSVYRSLPALGSLLFFSAFSNVIFGCIIFFFEQGTFQVDGTHYPDGWYMRVDLLGNLERSPFESIPLSIYYSVVSSTTVGYGDMTTTSEGGRFFSICCMYCGVMTLALPIAVIGNNFASLYDFFRGKVGIKLSKLFLINWIHSPHDTRKLIKQKVQDKFHHKGHDKCNPTTDDVILADPRIEDLILVHELVSKLSSLYVIGLSCTGPYFELLEDSLMYMNLLEGLELLTTNFSGCDSEEVFQAFSDYLDKLVGCNKFARSHVGSFATFGSVDDYEKNNRTKQDKKRVLDELISAKDTKFLRDADTLNTGRAKNSIHRSIAKIFIDALEREVSDTVAKVEDLSASIIRDNDELIVDVYKYPFIENERSVHHKASNWNEYWHSCVSEMFFFCKGKRNLIF